MGQHCYSRNGVLNIPEKQNYIILPIDIKFLESYLITVPKTKRNPEEREGRRERVGGRQAQRGKRQREEGEAF